METWGWLFNSTLFIALLVLGYFIGKAKERKHYRSIRTREDEFLHKPAITTRQVQPDRVVASTDLAIGSVVISVDYYKRFLASFRLLFGGELKSYSPLLDRGKREALLRMKESFPGADEYINCRLETSTISSGRGKAVGTVEVIAYSTAITYEPSPGASASTAETGGQAPAAPGTSDPGK